MARLSVSALTTLRWSLEEDLERYRQHSIPAIGLWRQKLSDFDEAQAAAKLAESGLATSSLAWAGGFTGNDGHTFRESLADARDALRLAAAVKAPVLIVYSGARAGHTHSHARRLFKTALTELAPLAADLGVTLAIEPIHIGCAGEWTFLTDLGETMDLIASVDHPRVRLVFDVYHLCQGGANVGRIREIAGSVALVQLGDSRGAPTGEPNRCRLGEGTLPLREIVAAFEQAGYRGDYELELMGEDVETSDYDELLCSSKCAFEKLV